MPQLSLFKQMNGGMTDGQVRKMAADELMLATWDGDINARVAFLYDYYHDDEKLVLNDLHPMKNYDKVPIDIKFITTTSQTYDKDAITYQIQLKPGTECNVDYYDECFAKRYGATFPIGLYIDIPDESGRYNKWLVVDRAEFNRNQFPTFYVLRCDKIIQYVMNGVKWQIAAVIRSQNSYNSGTWASYVSTTVEDQQKFTVPLNRDTEKIFYGLRLIIDGAVKDLANARAWHVTKVNRITPNGIARITLAQVEVDLDHDVLEYDSDGNVIGMWADLKGSTFTPNNATVIDSDDYVAPSITFSGVKPEIKVGGGYKKYTADTTGGVWSFTIDGADASDVILTSTNGLEANQIKVKFTGDMSYVGKVMTITYTVGTAVSKIEINIIGL